MSPSKPRVVYDCNVYVQALINLAGPGARCVDKARGGEVILFVSSFILDEIREMYRKVPAKYGVTRERTEALADWAAAVGVVVDEVAPVFTYKRDPDDAHYVNLALAAGAELVVSRDCDLLDLMDTGREEGALFRSRFPGLRILDPVQFLRELDGRV